MLTEQQLQYADAIRWFMYSGGGSGKTYLACYVAIEHAIDDLGNWAFVVDHLPHNIPDNYLAKTLQSCLENEFGGKYTLELSYGHGRVQKFRIKESQ